MPPVARRAIWIAFAFSLAVHAVLLAELPGLTFTAPPMRTTLNAELQRPLPPPAPPPRIAPARKPAPRAVRPAPAAVPQAPSIPVPRTAESVDPAPAPAPEPVAEASPEPAGAPTPALDPPPAPAAAEAPPTPESTPVAASSGTITYDLFYRGSGGSLGRSIQTWQIDRTSYRLTSVSEPVGLAAVFLSHRYAYTSEGRIGPEGLQPERFTAQGGRGGARRAAATFDYAKQEITYGASGTARTQALPIGTQDLLSFVYQIALAAELTPGKRQMIITSGSKIDTYALDIGEEEAIDLPVGPMRAIPVRRITTRGEEGVQFWLSSAPPRLPVRIRFFDSEGKMTFEQVAARIEFHGS